MSSEAIPFVDLITNLRSVNDEVESSIRRVLSSGQWILGPEVENFERLFAAYTGVGHCVGVGNGLDALRLTLMSMDIGDGDDVIVPANTFIATALAVSSTGARPVFVDVHEETFNIDERAVERAITERTKAIMPVHLTGQPANMTALQRIATSYSLRLIEDAAQAHGALYRKCRCGSLGDAACFSFYPSKNLGAIGDGGAITTNDTRIAERLRILRNYGQRAKYEHVVEGLNTRLDPLQAAVLGAKLGHLDRWNEARAKAAATYREKLAGVGDISFQAVMPESTHVFHLFIILTKHRSALQNYLSKCGIQTGIHYPIPVHLQRAFAHLGHKPGDFPRTEKLANTMLSLPMFPELRLDQIDRIVAAVIDFFGDLGTDPVEGSKKHEVGVGSFA